MSIVTPEQMQVKLLSFGKPVYLPDTTAIKAVTLNSVGVPLTMPIFGGASSITISSGNYYVYLYDKNNYIGTIGPQNNNDFVADKFSTIIYSKQPLNPSVIEKIAQNILNPLVTENILNPPAEITTEGFCAGGQNMSYGNIILIIAIICVIIYFLFYSNASCGSCSGSSYGSATHCLSKPKLYRNLHYSLQN